MKKLKPNYQLPRRKYFSEKILPSIHASVNAKVKTIIDRAENISLTTDIWTSNNNASFISLTAHCINIDFEQKAVVLRVIPFPGSHTATHITEVLQGALQEFNIPPYKIHLIIRDNGTNIVMGIDGTGFRSCLAFYTLCS